MHLSMLSPKGGTAVLSNQRSSEFQDGRQRRDYKVPVLLAKKSKRPHPGALILSQTPEGGEGKRGQMPHICRGSPPSGLTLIGALVQDSINACINLKN